MTILKTAVRVHKWLALIIGLQVFIWLLGGLVMSALPIERVRGEHKIASHPPIAISSADIIPLSDAISAAELSSVHQAHLTTLVGRPVWRIRSGAQTVLISATDAEILSPVSEALAREIADYDFLPEVEIEAITLLTNPPSEYGGPAPVWQIIFADDGDTRLYVDPNTGQVRARRSSTWRLFDFFWKLHVMDYDDGEDFNHLLLIGAAFLGVIVSIAGLIILFLRMRRSYGVWRTQKKRSSEM